MLNQQKNYISTTPSKPNTTLTIKTILLASISCAMLNGCASLSKEECMIGNWQGIGFTDGAAGYSANRISAHQKACAKVGVSANYKAWEQGRQEGLLRYCTKANAYNLGKRGERLNGVCPIYVVDELLAINQKGLQQHHLNTQINNDKKQKDKYITELKKLREGEMLEFENEKEARLYMLSLPSKISNLEYKIRQNERKLQRLPKPY